MPTRVSVSDTVDHELLTGDHFREWLVPARIIPIDRALEEL